MQKAVNNATKDTRMRSPSNSDLDKFDNNYLINFRDNLLEARRVQPVLNTFFNIDIVELEFKI